tara:strand:+ start:422 stop:595 length:174 start_codon:yes stop_codon:yes gene_type:complete
MEIKELTRAQLDEDIRNSLANASLYDRKWIWNYFKGHDEFPIVLDEKGGKEEPLITA